MTDPVATRRPLRKVWAGVVLALALSLTVLLLLVDRHEAMNRKCSGSHFVNAADLAALAGARELVAAEHHLNPTGFQIQETMLEYARRFGLEDPSALTAYYVDAAGSRLGPVVGALPPTATGIETVVTGRIPNFWSRIFGLPGRPVTARRVVLCDPDHPAPDDPFNCRIVE